MDRDLLEQIKNLVGLFEKRDQLYQQTTQEILKTVGPTALEALYTLFDVSYESVAWIEVQLIDNILLIVASITYGEDQDVPPVIQALSPIKKTDEASVRLFQVGLPLAVIFQPKDDIVAYLTKTASAVVHDQEKPQVQETPVEDNSVPVNSPVSEPEFDTSGLTHDQIQQLLVFAHRTRGTKH